MTNSVTVEAEFEVYEGSRGGYVFEVRNPETGESTEFETGELGMKDYVGVFPELSEVFLGD